MSARPQLAELQAGAALLLNSSDEPSISLSLEQLDYHGITSLALEAGSLTTDLTQQLQSRQAMMVANEALKTHALTELGKAFQVAGLQPLVFKGSALAHLVYCKPWLRPRTDTDLFVDYSHLAQCDALFTKLGYQKLFAIEGETVSYQATYAKALTNKVALNIDLHWRINNRQILAGTFTHTELYERSVQLSEISFNTPSNPDHLLIACLHRLGHHQREERLAWLYDIHLLANSLSQPQWAQFELLAMDKQLAAITQDALNLCQTLFNTEAPANIQQSLKRAAMREEPSKIFLRREMPEWRIALYELAALPDWRTRTRWLRETLFPSADYLRQRMGTQSLLIAHGRRWWRGLKRIARS